MTKIRLESCCIGFEQVEVFKGKNKRPHFSIVGASMDQLDKNKIREYLDGCDWTDQKSPAYCPPYLRCDDFLKDKKTA
jgi:hypothetical protein